MYFEVISLYAYYCAKTKNSIDEAIVPTMPNVDLLILALYIATQFGNVNTMQDHYLGWTLPIPVSSPVSQYARLAIYIPDV